MKNLPSFFRTNINSRKLLLAISLSVLTACGGGSDDEETASTGGNDEGGIIGTAKIIVKSDSKAEAKSKSGKKFSAKINAQGKFKFANKAPESFLLRTQKKNPNTTATKPEKQYLYSIAHSDGNKQVTRNLHPYTDLIVRNWFATHKLDVKKEFESSQPIKQLPTKAEIAAIEKEVDGIVAKVLADYGVQPNIDLIATPFDINGKGFDRFLDNNPVVINSDDSITIIFKQKSGNAIHVSVSKLKLKTNLTTANDAAPTTPSNVIAVPQSASSIIIRWKASSDDKGVAGYNVFRINGAKTNKIATTAFPIYIDSALQAGTNYRYQIQAIDSRNQTSAKTSATAPVTPDANAIVSLDGVYDVVTTSLSVETYCSGAHGSFSLSNETDLTGSVSSDTNSSYVFNLNGKRDKNTAAVTGSFAVVNGITYASITGIIDALSSNGKYEDIRGCKGVWVATKR